jgi:hypothetical protein
VVLLALPPVSMRIPNNFEGIHMCCSCTCLHYSSSVDLLRFLGGLWLVPNSPMLRRCCIYCLGSFCSRPGCCNNVGFDPTKVENTTSSDEPKNLSAGSSSHGHFNHVIVLPSDESAVSRSLFSAKNDFATIRSHGNLRNMQPKKFHIP